jgi:peptidoglycan/LPS O-acetylase OafA/YrhL
VQTAYNHDSTVLKYRKEIDGLRFIAVASVVVGHYFPNQVPQGYLGVDIFFVISGYVITQLLFSMEKDLASSFLVTFYAKRIRRIIPALFVVVMASLLVFFLVVTRLDRSIGHTGALSLLGLSNLYLWLRSSDYFGLASSQNPFTHTWSLGVEEQFYALYPFCFLLTWKLVKKKKSLILLILISATSFISLLLNIQLSHSNRNLVFYSMLTRFWEFGVGVLVFLLVTRNLDIGKRLGNYNFLILFVLMSTFFLNSGIIVLNQIIAVTATGFLLFPYSNSIVHRFLSYQKLTWIGLRSYSIYLIHWPILVLINYLFGLGNIQNWLGIILTVLLSALMYRFIENPFRVGRLKASSMKTVAFGVPFVLLVTASILYFTQRNLGSDNYVIPRLIGVKDVAEWIPTKCSGKRNIEKLANPITDCLGGSKASKAKFVYLIGDSHADHLVPMVKAAFTNPIFEVRNLNMEYARDFPFGDFIPNTNSPSLKYLELNAKSGDLVLLSFHRGHLNARRDVHISLAEKIEITPQTNNLVNNLDRFSKRMRKIGVKVILIKDTPLMNSVQSSQSCAIQLKIFGTNGCKVSRVQDTKTRFRQSYAFDEVVKFNKNTFTWDPLNTIYGSSKYFDVIDSKGDYLMWDWNHITQDFSAKLAPNFKDSIKDFINKS